MVARRVKRKEGENLTPQNIEKVISLLEQGKPITKKEACNILSIAYNTVRLQKIIEEHKENKSRDEKRRAANRGKPASDLEIKDVITWYLEGESLKEIGDRLYRSTGFVKNIVDMVGIPQRRAGENYVDFEPLPEQCISDKFEAGQLAWSSRYQGLCIIDKELGKSADGVANIYRIYVVEPFEEPEVKYFASWGAPGFYAVQPAYELGSLEHLKKYGVDVARKVNASTSSSHRTRSDKESA